MFQSLNLFVGFLLLIVWDFLSLRCVCICCHAMCIQSLLLADLNVNYTECLHPQQADFCCLHRTWLGERWPDPQGESPTRHMRLQANRTLVQLLQSLNLFVCLFVVRPILKKKPQHLATYHIMTGTDL